jgi:hypothetical protein
MPESRDGQPGRRKPDGRGGRARDSAERGGAQGWAYRVLGQLFEVATRQNLPTIEWTISASGWRLLGRCTGAGTPAQRRADFEAWRAALDADVSEAAASREVTRLTGWAERDDGLVTITIVADLYDDLAARRQTVSPGKPPHPSR